MNQQTDEMRLYFARVRPLCGGGCFRYRDFYFSQPGYCPYQDFLTSALPGLRQAASLAFQ